MNTLFRKFFSLSLLISFSITIYSQVLTNKEYIKAIKDADLYYYFNEDYEAAASLYENLLKKYPGNCNLAAKLGICYLNMDGKKADALSLLIKASENVVSSDNEYLEYGFKAPMDTWFYLAHAYHLNDNLNSAINLYTDVKKKLGPSQAFRIDYIDNQINACRYAIEMKSSPVSTSIQLFIPWLVDYPGANYPIVSKNDSVFMFTQIKDGKNHIYCSYKNTTWQKPVDITSQLGSYDRLYSNSLTGKGDHLLLYMDDGADGNLFSSQRNGTTWSKIRKLGKNINTKYWEAYGFITPDGEELFFSSNRPGGFGELDIWMSKLDENGDWGAAVNLGNDINTPYNENTPFFLPESGILFFSSLGNTGMGGYDVFSSVLKNTKWTKPIGMPYPVNNTENNSFFASYGNRIELYNKSCRS